VPSAGSCHPPYTGIIALAVSLIVVVVGSFVFRAMAAPAGEEVTRSEDFEVEAGDQNVRPLPGTPEQAEAATT
jgi:hypothetical protein